MINLLVGVSTALFMLLNDNDDASDKLWQAPIVVYPRKPEGIDSEDWESMKADARDEASARTDALMRALGGALKGGKTEVNVYAAKTLQGSASAQTFDKVAQPIVWETELLPALEELGATVTRVGK